jgi:hypothetical protein
MAFKCLHDEFDDLGFRMAIVVTVGIDEEFLNDLV